MFSILVEREFTEKNPFTGVKDLKETPGNLHKPYNDEQIKLLRKEIPNRDPFLWSFIQFVFFCFIRPGELMRLRIANIEMESGTIFIPGKISKNGKDGRVAMPKPLIKHIAKMKLHNYPEDYLIFGDNDAPGMKVMPHNKMSRRYRTMLEDLKFGKEHTLYSWKHTGNTKLYYASNKDIILIMRQNRHSSLDMTYNYMRSLGMEIDSSGVENFRF